MKTIAKNKKLIFIILSLLFAFMLLFTYVPMIAQADEEPIEENEVVVEAYARNGGKINLESPINYSGKQAYVFDWSNLEKFVFYYKANSLSDPPVDYIEGQPHTPENKKYTLNVTVKYLQSYTDAGTFENLNTITLNNYYTETVTGDNSFQNFVLKKFTLNVDDGITGEINHETKVVRGWGIYEFIFEINGSTLPASDFFVVRPTLYIPNAPIITYEEVSSDNSMHSSFNFTLTNAEEYKYIDSNALVWYIKGEGADGTKYALTKDDLDKNIIPECDGYLYESYERTGTTFLFNDNEKSGKWEIWCEYKSHDSEGAIKSNFKNVETGSHMSITAIVWIIVALGVVALGFVLAFAIIKKKKEKVW